MTDLLDRLKAALADRYRIERELGRGGMATVYLAEDLKHHRQVAVKVLRPELAAALGLERFLREIEIAAHLQHPHVLPLYDSGEAGGFIYYVMPYVEGESLADKLRRETQLPVEEAVRIASEVADALAFAHDHGVVHRDIKPHNILLSGGHAVVADFGVARALDAGGGERLTSSGIAIGTPHYMSPEQGSADGKVDARSDIYSLGCVLFQMLTGEPPFTGRNAPAIIARHLSERPPSAQVVRAAVPDVVEWALHKSLAKTAADRFQTARELSEALAQPDRVTPATLLASAIRRRVPHVLALYAAGAALIVWLFHVVVDLFVWSPHLPAFGLVALASLIPVVTIVAYARDGHKRGLPAAVKLAVPANIFGSAVILWLAFGSKDLGAATTSIVVEDENGNTVERIVPKSAFRKRLAIFFFENAGDSTDNWLQYGLPLALDLDLTQDMFLQTATGEAMVEDARKAGYASGVGLPLTLMRELADKTHLPFFVSGTYARGYSDTLTVTLGLYETRRGRLLRERTYRRTDMFALVDEASIQLKRDLGVPSQYIEDTEDLPVAETLTASEDAFKLMTEAYHALVFDGDWAGATAAISSAVAIDPTNAYARVLQYQIALLGNDQASASAALTGVMQHIYKLPERVRYQVKFRYYDFQQQAEKATAVLQIWVDLLPDDIEGRLMFARVLVLRDRREEAIEQYEAVLEIDPSQTQYLKQLGDLARNNGAFERAQGYFQRYADEHPDDYRSYTALGGLQRVQGDFEAAKASYERAMLLEPDNIAVMVNRAILERYFGNFEGAIGQLQQALRRSKTARDSVQVLTALQDAYGYLGRAKQALQVFEQRMSLAQRFSPPIQVLAQRLSAMDAYMQAGQEAQARQILASGELQLQAPFEELASLGHLGIALELEDPDAAEVAIAGVDRMIAALGAQSIEPVVLHARARVLEMRDRYQDAIAAYAQELDRNPTDISIHTHMGRCYRKLGDLDQAEEHLRRSLASYPYSPKVHFQMALVIEERGDTAQAIGHLETAMRAWDRADPEYAPGRRLREKLSELRPDPSPNPP
jgi:tetratricopeptide (TPR) repeat protein